MSENLKKISESIDAVRGSIATNSCCIDDVSVTSGHLDILLSQIATEISGGGDTAVAAKGRRLRKLIEGKL